jgi:glucans biosynthesis protein
MPRRPLLNSGGLIVLAMAMAVLVLACNTGIEPDTTLVQPAWSANPAETRDLYPVSASTLFADLIERSRRLAHTDYTPAPDALPPALTDLDYDQYRAIRFRPESALWRDVARFELQLFHPGFVHRDTVRLHVVQDGEIVRVPFDPTVFRYDGPAASVAGTNAPELGHAGFRIHYPLNDAATKDEVVVFLGASYFRLLGRGHAYGLSSRGLAVDTALDRGEEFPVFREFWLRRPGRGDDSVTLYALLDSPSITGAYEFVLTPGAGTTMDVDARLFARRDIEKVGIAPMSSMFLYGPNRIPTFDDFRPQVHDSDGLLVHTSEDEWRWRPLSNGPGVRVTAVAGDTPRGFGLVQRDRQFERYLDVEANYHRRPSEWVVPGAGDWGTGRVELLSYSTVSEFNDNIAAYWVPDRSFRAGDERRYAYRLMMFDDRVETQTLAHVQRTRIGWDALPGEREPPPRSQRRFVVDFVSGDNEPAPSGPLDAVLESSTGEVTDLVVQTLPTERGWRASFRLVPDGRQPAELGLYLLTDGRRLTETWDYVWYPDHVQE